MVEVQALLVVLLMQSALISAEEGQLKLLQVVSTSFPM